MQTLNDLHKKSKPGKNRNKNKIEELPYNKPFTDRELKAATNQHKNSTRRGYSPSPVLQISSPNKYTLQNIRKNDK